MNGENPFVIYVDLVVNLIEILCVHTYHLFCCSSLLGSFWLPLNYIKHLVWSSNSQRLGMAEVFWSVFCGNSECSSEDGKRCSYGFLSIIDPNTCINNSLVISVDFLLMLMFLYMVIYRSFSRKIVEPSHSEHFSPILIFSAISNGALGLAYLGSGIWICYKELKATGTILPLHGWLVMLFQGFTWLLLDFAVIIDSLHFQHFTISKLCSIVAFLFAGFLCFSSIWVIILDKLV